MRADISAPGSSTDTATPPIIAPRDAPPPPRRGIGRGVTERTYEARIARDDNTMRDAAALRYRSYRAQGHIEANSAGLFRDAYDDRPNATTIVVYAEHRAVASARVCTLRRGDGSTSPARDNYRPEVDDIMARSGPPRDGIDGIEVNRLVRAPEAEDDQGLVFMLYRLAARIALVNDFRFVISCVRANHVPFYRRRMRFQPCADPKPYPGLNCAMALLNLPRDDWELMRADFRLMDPDAGPPGLLDGLEHGATVHPHIVRRGEA